MYDSILIVLWLLNISSQMSGDFSDPKHPSLHPWYLTRSCEAASKETATACRVSQATFALAILMLLLYAGRLALTSVHGIRTYHQRRERNGYERISVKLDLLDDDGEPLRSSAEIERERYLCREALSPVLAFFPEDVR